MNGMLETPSRVWRRIEDIERGDLPSLPSLPAFDDSRDQHTEETDSIDDMDISNDSNPIHSTPAAFSSHTMSTIRQPLSTGSTARFANSIASRSSKSGLAVSRSASSVSRQNAMQSKDYSFDISVIPTLPTPRDDIEIRSSDQDTSNRDSSQEEPRLPPMDPDTGDELDLSDALQSVSRAGSPLPNPEPTPRKKYDYSVSLRSEPQVCCEFL